jgi:RimJ/RimL family protein N-acetyltransferase
VSVTVRAAPPEHLSWLASRAHLTLTPALRAREAVDETGRILGMVGFDGWLGNACQVHVALEDPRVLRRLARDGFRIVFEELGYAACMAPVLGTNARSLRMVAGLGFREVHRGKDWIASGVDLVFHEMRREECRWVA